MNIKLPPWHLFFLSIYPVVFLYTHNLEKMPIITTQKDIVLMIGAGFALSAVVLFYVLNFLFKEIHRSRVVSSLAAFALLSIGQLFVIVEDNMMLFAGIAFLFLGLVILYSVKNFDFDKIGKILNLFSGTLICLALVPLITYSLTQKRGSPLSEKREFLSVKLKAKSEKPDVYYLIPDSYAHHQVLEEMYGHDNSSFLNFLKEKGFFVADKSISNYAFTYMAMSAALNMRYIDEVTEVAGKSSKDMSYPTKLIHQNEVFNLFKRLGYQIININSVWGPFNEHPMADINLNCDNKTKFETMLIDATVLRFIPYQNFLKSGDSGLKDTNVYRRFFNCFKYMMKDVHKLAGPKLVVGHLGSPPHEPFVYDRNGNPREEIFGNVSELAKENKPLDSYKSLYVDQVVYLNKVLKGIVTNILNESEKQPIFIIQSDTGPVYTEAFATGFHQLNDGMIKEHHRILSAILAPPEITGKLYHEISPINTFRVIMSYFTEEEFERLPDRSYYSNAIGDYDKSPEGGAPFVFIDVTDRIWN